MKLLTPKQLATQLSLKPPTITKWIREGRIKAIKIGRLWRIEQREAEALINFRSDSKNHKSKIASKRTQSETQMLKSTSV